MSEETLFPLLDRQGRVLPNAVWTQDESAGIECWDLHLESAHLWIEKRPHYCDRGHWKGNVRGPLPLIPQPLSDLDEQDGFPRYYMDLSVAKQELRKWLYWRLYQIDIPDHSGGPP